MSRKDDFIEMPIFDVVKDYIGFCKFAFERRMTKANDKHNLPTLNTIRGIIIDRYYGRLEPSLNFMEQCFVKSKATELGIELSKL